MKVTPVVKNPDYLSFGMLAQGTVFKVDSQEETFQRRLFIKINDQEVMMFMIGDFDCDNAVVIPTTRLCIAAGTAVVRRRIVEITFSDY